MLFFGKIIKYILWYIFSIIVFVLFVGLAKMHRSVRGYITFLNSNDWSVSQLSQPANWSDSFWPKIQSSSGISDMLSGDAADSIAS